MTTLPRTNAWPWALLPTVPAGPVLTVLATKFVAALLHVVELVFGRHNEARRHGILHAGHKRPPTTLRDARQHRVALKPADFAGQTDRPGAIHVFRTDRVRDFVGRRRPAPAPSWPLILPPMTLPASVMPAKVTATPPLPKLRPCGILAGERAGRPAAPGTPPTVSAEVPRTARRLRAGVVDVLAELIRPIGQQADGGRTCPGSERRAPTSSYRAAVLDARTGRQVPAPGVRHRQPTPVPCRCRPVEAPTWPQVL